VIKLSRKKTVFPVGSKRLTK